MSCGMYRASVARRPWFGPGRRRQSFCPTRDAGVAVLGMGPNEGGKIGPLIGRILHGYFLRAGLERKFLNAFGSEMDRAELKRKRELAAGLADIHDRHIVSERVTNPPYRGAQA